MVNHRRKYSELPRGAMIEKFGIEYVPHYEKGKYDVALLHLDQQCLEEKLWEGGKGSVFKELSPLITDIPKIVIMHGTPYYPEMFGSDIRPETYKEMGFTESQINMSSSLIQTFKEITKDFDIIIFNSKTALRQWGFENDPRARAIWHGMDEDEWRDLPKEPRVVTMISPGGMPKYYDRDLLKAVKEELQERSIEHCHITVDAQFTNWDEYRNFLGRSLLYFNPTRESPMPRSRTEAMFSGCCVISTLNQDSEEFIKDGVNGFRAIRNPKYIADVIEKLLSDYDLAIKIGQEGKKTALELFSGERFRKIWSDLLTEVIEKHGKVSKS